MFKKSYFRGPFDKQHGKRAKALLKFTSQHLHDIHQSLLKKLSWKKSLLLRCKILGVLVNRLAASEKYLVLHRDNLAIPIQMQLSHKQKSEKLSQKQKNFSQFFAAILKSRLNFKYFEWKGTPHRFCIFEVTDSQYVAR